MTGVIINNNFYDISTGSTKIEYSSMNGETVGYSMYGDEVPFTDPTPEWVPTGNLATDGLTQTTIRLSEPSQSWRYTESNIDKIYNQAFNYFHNKNTYSLDKNTDFSTLNRAYGYGGYGYYWLKYEFNQARYVNNIKVLIATGNLTTNNAYHLVDPMNKGYTTIDIVDENNVATTSTQYYTGCDFNTTFRVPIDKKIKSARVYTTTTSYPNESGFVSYTRIGGMYFDVYKKNYETENISINAVNESTYKWKYELDKAYFVDSISFAYRPQSTYYVIDENGNYSSSTYFMKSVDSSSSKKDKLFNDLKIGQVIKGFVVYSYGVSTMDTPMIFKVKK